MLNNHGKRDEELFLKLLKENLNHFNNLLCKSEIIRKSDNDKL